MSGKWTLKYGSAAVITAVAIIAISLIANPLILPTPIFAAASFAVMLTDPPIVPTGTTVLNLTYSEFSLHLTYPNATTEWLALTASGTVNLFSLINMSQTLATTTIPVGSLVDKIQFNIEEVKTIVNGTAYNVTTLSDTLVIKVDNGYVNQTISGVLLDFNPTLIQIQSTDAEDVLIYYYVLVPGATAIIIEDLSQEQIKVGTIIEITENNRVRLIRVHEEFKNNITIVSASLSLTGNNSSLEVTLRNDGNISFRIFGLTLHGEFNITQTKMIQNNIGNKVGHFNNKGSDNKLVANNYQNDLHMWIFEKIHPLTIPFKINDTSLIPIFGNNQRNNDNEKDPNNYYLTIEPRQSVTLNFDGILELPLIERNNIKTNPKIITPIAGQEYILRLIGQGLETCNITATS